MDKKQLRRNIEQEMTEYVLYIRTRAGTTTRKSFPIFWCYESLVPYVHEEALVGWPEQKVFWAIKEGPSVGMAPYKVQITRQEPAQKPAGLQSHSSI
ncbi:MAG TPA: hypothetical protein VGP12_03915 [Nitrosospira sp.]|jgi:hypothetical protein|nr:hypothetical protein [Nitrosospira sp.]